MATNPRFDIASSSLDNAAYGYPNSHRSHYSTGSGGPSLERVSSFRESHDGSGRGGTPGGAGPAFPNVGNVITHGELPPLSQVLSLEQIATGDSKSSKQPELKRATAAALALIGEGQGGFQPKPIEQQGPEELKRIRSSLLENSSKAKERSRVLLEAITKLDKFRTSIVSRRRVRREAHAHERPLISVSGERSVPTPSAAINPNKASFCASPSHVSMGEGSMPKLEDKSKGPVPNRRVRTSMLDVRLEGRANMSTFQRSSGIAERDRESIKSGASLGGLPDEKDRLVAPSGEAWEKTKTKGRRSTTKSDCVMTAAASGVPDIEREHKWGVQHRSNTENRPRSTEGHSFRSGPVHGVMSIHKSAIRNEPDNAGPSGDKESRFIITDKDQPTPTIKSGVKLASHKDEGTLMSPTTVAKAKAARAPRSGTGIPVIPTSSHAPRPPSSELWERAPATGAPTRAQLPSNRKRPAPSRSSSPPVTQWVGQRPQKMSRVARRMIIAPPMGPPGPGGARDEGIPNMEVAPVREPTPTGVRSNPSTSPVAGLVKRVASTAALSQIKSKLDRVASPAGISESDDSEGADIKSKEKWKKHADSEGRFAPVNQKMAPLSGKKSRVVPKEEGGDGMRRQGRSGRAIIAVRESSNVTLIEKGDPSANAKQLRSARPGTDKMEKPVDVKPGRPPNKKGGIGDRKALTRPRRPATNTGGEVSGESDDDREELAAAVQAAVNASATACSSLFWKEIEPFFAYLTPDARNSLSIQVKARELEDEEFLPSLTSDTKAEKAQNTPLDSTAVGRTTHLSNGAMDINRGVVSKVSNSKNDHTLDGNKAGLSGGWPIVKELPLSQRLLAALIIEGDIDDDSREDRSQLELQGYAGDGSSHDLSDSEQAGMEKDQDSESEVETRRVTVGKLNGRTKSSSYDVSYTSNGHRHWDSESELLNSPVKSELRKEEEKQGLDMNGLNKWEGRYQSLTLDERIALELQSLGLYPEQGELPTREDDQIAEELKRSQLELKELVHVNKERLSSLEKNVSNARVIEERERERLAMIKLLENAFNKRLGTRGGHLGVSGSKNAASKAGRAAAVAIAKRSLARWKHYVDTEESCFNEAGLREILFCVPPKEGDMKTLSNTGEMRVGINSVGLTLTGSSELKLAASAGTRWICRAFGTDKVDKDSCESDQPAVGTPSERTGDKDDIWCTRPNEREVLLEEVGGSGSVGSVLCGTKGKRSERDGTGKGSGRQGLGAIKGERKTKTKPRQKTAPLLKAVNGLLGKPSELPEKSGARIKQESMGVGLGGADAQGEGEGTIDLSHLQIPGMDDLVGNGDLGGQGQDLGSWLDFDDPGLPDAGGDFMGLDVPMDDLADLSMIM
ncbi:hypothetical protein GOP47_0008529 [Adiantum capillus-veneris]|uniref:Uncharacterized protein n=1 Tax=Adiantum capillus-veneris TaxID=13818 RepID=A0A9D4ZIA1_ADICA|nr:hypothetical protein GOP47_0008529 [Adiantum capillus-veneris]